MSEVYLLKREYLNPHYGTVEAMEIVCAFADRIEAECMLQRLDDARRGFRISGDRVRHLIEEVAFHG